MMWAEKRSNNLSSVVHVEDYMSAPFPNADFSPAVVGAWKWNLASNQFQCSEAIGMTSVCQGLPFHVLDMLDQAQADLLISQAKKACQSGEEFSFDLSINQGGLANDGAYRLMGSPYLNNDNTTEWMSGVLLRLGNSSLLNDQYLPQTEPLIYVKDTEHRFIFINRACQKALGKSAADLLGKTIGECTGQDASSQERFEEWLMSSNIDLELQEQAVAEQIDFVNDQTTYSTKRFSLKDKAGNVVGTGAFIVDVTVDEKALRIIANLDVRRRQLIEAMPALIFYFDRQGKAQLVNNKVAKLLKASKESLYGKTMSGIAPSWERSPELDDGVSDVLSGKKSSVKIDASYVQEGQEYWIKIEISPVLNIDNSIANALVVVRDVSHMQQQKRKIEDQEVRARALMENSFEAMYSVSINPPMPMSLRKDKQVDWFAEYAYFEDCNERCAELLRRNVDKVLYHKVNDIVGTFDPERNLFSTIIENELRPQRVEVEHMIDGECQWWEHSAKPIITDGKLYELWGSFRNVTEAKRRAVELENNEARYRSFIENSHEGIFEARLKEPVRADSPTHELISVLYESLTIRECNDEFSKLCGIDNPTDVVGLTLSEASGENVARKLVEEFASGNFKVARLPLNVAMGNAQATWISISLVGVFNDDLLCGCWGTLRDVTERYHYLQRLEYQANHDSLTNLPNRQKFYTVLENHLQYVSESNPLAVVLLDLDRFKELNDTLGHHIGDLLLKKIGPRLETVVKTVNGMVARLGGDEFAIVLPGTNNDEWRTIARALCDAVNEPFNLNGFQAEIKASIGLALAPKHASDISGLMRYADIAMYQAKNESLGFIEYDASLDAYTPRRLSLMNDLGKAIRENQFELYFQPKIDLGGRFIRGFEALLRWNHPGLGFLPPGEFIPLAESTENIKPITLWVLESAIKSCSEWLAKKLDCKVAVNLSARNLLDENIVDMISTLLERYKVPPKFLELEITESSIMLDPKRAADIMRQMGELGVNLSIDDYGTGYSSLAYLKSLPVDTLKIDYSFVKDMLVDKHDAIIVNSTIHLAHNLGLKVVAEGVESAEALTELDRMGCDLAQGYYIAPPMPAEAVEPWIANAGWSSLRNT
ncbi:hypothetical protein NBRC116495_21140 [Aurantivibrio plasticivorans]